MSDVAKRAGVSNAAVSRYLNHSGYLSAEKRAAVERAIEELDFRVPANHASRYPNRKTLAILLPPFENNAYFVRLISEFTKASEAAGYHTLNFHANLMRENFCKVLQKICAERVCGIFVPSFPMMELDRESLDFLRDSEVPVVLLSEFPKPYAELNCLVVDNAAGAAAAVRELAAAGCRKLAYFGAPKEENKSSAQRIDGFLAACADAGFQKEQLVVATEPLVVETIFAQSGYVAACRAFAQTPDIDGICAWTDAFAAGVLWRLAEIGKKVPEDVKIVSFDDDYAPYLCPPLTTLVLPPTHMGREAVALLVRLQDASERMITRQIRLCPILIRRKSCGK